MTITTKEQGEQLTRQAAAAIGFNLSSAEWEYNQHLRGMWRPSGGQFAPLTNSEHCHMLEVKLNMNILYRAMPAGGMLLQIARPGEAGSTVQSIDTTDFEAAMRVRRECVVKFAALCAIMDDKVAA